MQALSANFQAGLPWGLLCADDLILVAIRGEVTQRIEILKKGIEESSKYYKDRSNEVSSCKGASRRIY